MVKRVLISRPRGTELEVEALRQVAYEIDNKRTGRTPTYKPSPELQRTREKAKVYTSISDLTPLQLEELAIKYHSQ